jgi:tetratricopeptide (TPR) repeat protein
MTKFIGQARRRKSYAIRKEHQPDRSVSDSLKAIDLQNADELAALADKYCAVGKRWEARSLYVRALELRERWAGSSDPIVLAVLAKLARVYESTGRDKEAETTLRRLVHSFGTANGDEPILTEPLLTLGNFHWRKGDFPEARKALTRALSILEKTQGADHPDTVDLLKQLAILAGNCLSAGASSNEAHTDALNLLRVLNEIGEIYRQDKSHAQSADFFRRSLYFAEKEITRRNSSVSAITEECEQNSLSNIAEMFNTKGMLEQAQEMSRQALKVMNEFSEAACQPREAEDFLLLPQAMRGGMPPVKPTDREIAVLKLAIEGASVDEISRRLKLTPSTICKSLDEILNHLLGTAGKNSLDIMRSALAI